MITYENIEQSRTKFLIKATNIGKRLFLIEDINCIYSVDDDNIDFENPNSCVGVVYPIHISQAFTIWTQ